MVFSVDRWNQVRGVSIMRFPADREIYSGKLTCKNLSGRTGKRRRTRRTRRRRRRRKRREHTPRAIKAPSFNIFDGDPCVCVGKGEEKESPPARTSISKKRRREGFKENYLLSFLGSRVEEWRKGGYLFIYLFIIIITKMIKGNADPLKWLSNAPPFLGIESSLLSL